MAVNSSSVFLPARYSFDSGGRSYGRCSSAAKSTTSPSKSLSRNASAAFAPASPPPTMTKVSDFDDMTRRYAAARARRRHFGVLGRTLRLNVKPPPISLRQGHQLPEPAGVAHGVPAEVVVEVHVDPLALVMPRHDAVGPPAQVIADRSRIQRAARGRACGCRPGRWWHAARRAAWRRSSPRRRPGAVPAARTRRGRSTMDDATPSPPESRPA